MPAFQLEDDVDDYVKKECNYLASSKLLNFLMLTF